MLEAQAWSELHGNFGLRAGPEMATVKRWGRSVALVSQAADIVAVNRAIAFGFDEPFGRHQLTELRQFFQEHRKERWFVDASPGATIDSEAIAAFGGVEGGRVVKLAGEIPPLGSLPRVPVEMRSVLPSEAGRFMELVGGQLGVPERVRGGIASTIGHPGWHYYFAVHEEKPVAGAAMYISGDGAWLGLAGTVPWFRNQGAQTALLVQRMRDAKAAGCRWVSAETMAEAEGQNQSLKNMNRLGLPELYRRPWYRFQEPVCRARST